MIKYLAGVYNTDGIYTPQVYLYKSLDEICRTLNPRGCRCVLPQGHTGFHAASASLRVPQWRD